MAASMVIALLLIAAPLLLVRFPLLPLLQNMPIELRLLADIEPPTAAEAEPKESLQPTPLVEHTQSIAPEEITEVVEWPDPQPTDWFASAVSAVQESVNAANHVESMHPALDAKRRHAAINFPASRAPVKKPIWENVETDQLGRKILVSGNCYRVIEDPSAINYDIQRDFTQFIVYCNGDEEKPMDVAWVDDIRKRYDYLNVAVP